jgi:ACS/CODH beta subunit C-terminal
MSHQHPHTHGAAVKLAPETAAILERGLAELLDLTDGLEFKPLVSERYPLPLSLAVYGETPDAARVRADVEKHLKSDPVAALESALVLLELAQCNELTAAEAVPDDGKFLNMAFGSKRLNGWIALLGEADRAGVEAAVNARWQFKFIDGPGMLGGLYVLLNMLCRYGFVYGRIGAGDSHAMGHFIEDFTPGLLICRGDMTDLELTMSLAAMKLGVPALCAPDYPFELGRRAPADGLEEIVSGATFFPNIRKLLDLPELPRLPKYLDAQSSKEEFEPAAAYGATEESFYVFRKGEVPRPDAVEVVGEPGPAMGVLLTADAEPLDAFDRQYIEARAARVINMLRGVRARIDAGRLVVEIAPEYELDAARVGEVLVAAVRNEFPGIARVAVEIVFDAERLAAEVAEVRARRAARKQELAATTEESMDEFITCLGCSPFAPDHVCVLTPERMPQCGRPYAQIKTGAHYGYDDMSNIHHRELHAGLNSFGTAPKGEVIDEAAGEWSGINAAVARLSGGRTTRVQLHSLESAPHTGCGCFQLIAFKTEQPRTGVAVMDRKYKGTAPDGRSWRDLHYALAGKQAPGMAGAAPNYLKSGKFLAAHGGWEAVVWVSPRIARTMGDDLPAGVEVGPETE